MAAQLDFTSKTTINADAGGWDPANARAMVYCSDLAYADPAHVDQTLTTWNLKLEKFLNVDDTQGFLASGDDGLGIVAFRGTQPTDLIDWATDANCVLVQDAPGKVHSGFKRALDLVWSDVDSFMKTKQRVFVTGHSLGGALACLAAARAVHLNTGAAKALTLFTYGQPRVGDAFLADDTTRLVIRTIGKDALHEPAAMIVDHFMDHYSRLLDGTTGLADS